MTPDQLAAIGIIDKIVEMTYDHLIMKSSVLCILLALLTSSAVSADDLQKRVTLSFKNADLVEVIKAVAHEIGRNPYIAWTVQDTVVSIDIVDLPAADAFRQILATQDTKHDVRLKGRRNLIVATPEALDKVCQDPWVPSPDILNAPVRMECLLDEASSATIVDLLKTEFPNVEFSPHPTVNGFFVRGSKDDLIKIKRKLPSLDRAP